MSRKSDVLRKGAQVVFLRPPQGSYLSAGKPYRVTNTDRRAVHFWADSTASGTSETRTMLDTSEFTVLT